MRLGERIREFRCARGLSQEQLAELADISRDAVSRIERADREPRLETLIALSQALGVSLGELLSIDEGPPEQFDANELRILRVMRHLCSVDGRTADRVVAAVAAMCAPLPPVEPPDEPECPPGPAGTDGRMPALLRRLARARPSSE